MNRPALLLVAVLVSTPVQAGEAGTPADEAHALFEKAVQRLHGGRFAEARDLLARSLLLAPNPGTAFNLAVACRGTGEVLRALELLDGLLGGAQASLRPEQRYDALRLRESVRDEVALVSIEAVGAPIIQLRVDGRQVGEIPDGGRLEWRIDPGERLVSAMAQDRIPADRRIRVPRGGRASVRLALSPTSEARVGTLIVEAAEDDQEIEAVGVARARGRLERAVPPGDYQVRLLVPGAEREATLTVEPRSTVRFQFDGRASLRWWRRPIVWATGAAVLGAAAVAGVLLLRPGHQDPVRDSVYGAVEALREAP